MYFLFLQIEVYLHGFTVGSVINAAECAKSKFIDDKMKILVKTINLNIFKMTKLKIFPL